MSQNNINQSPSIVSLQNKSSKNRVYVSNPQEAPENLSVEEGPEGGYYYETDDTSTGNSETNFNGTVELAGMNDSQKQDVSSLIGNAVDKGWMENVDSVTTDPEAGVKESAIAAYNPFTGDLYINPDKFDEETLAEGEESGWLVDGTKEGMFAHEVAHARHREEAKDQLFDAGGGTVVDLSEDEKEMLENEVSKTASQNLLEAIAEIHAGLVSGEQFSDEVMEFYNQFDGPEVNNGS